MSGSKNVYASVKSYSKRGKLLKRADFQTLAESRDLDELVTRIKNTVYVDAVSDVEKPYTSQNIESALRSSLAEVHYSIAKTAGGAGILDAILLEIYYFQPKTNSKRKSFGENSRRD